MSFLVVILLLQKRHLRDSNIADQFSEPIILRTCSTLFSTFSGIIFENMNVCHLDSDMTDESRNIQLSCLCIQHAAQGEGHPKP